jgi:hypothetical protein
MGKLEKLKAWLRNVRPGKIDDDSDLSTLLADAWDEIQGTRAQNTQNYKLIDRIERVVWEPPVLEFTIERHGGTVQGSSRAELHRWTIDLNQGVARCNPSAGFRQIIPSDKKMDVEVPAGEVAAAIVARREDARLKWDNDMQIVQVLVSNFIGGRSKQTVAGRRKRFRTCLEQKLAESAWLPAIGRSPNTYTIRK